MAKKRTNENLSGLLHYVTANVRNRKPIFRDGKNCIAFLKELQRVRREFDSRLICFVIMLDHFHLIVNPRDGNIQRWIGALKGASARVLIDINTPGLFADGKENQVWQESFRTLRLWSGWMIWQKINYIHSNPCKAGLVNSARDYRWSSFRPFYRMESEELVAIDHEWWYEDDPQKLKNALGFDGNV
jgi:putative transposase